jgi:hypothetical protein
MSRVLTSAFFVIFWKNDESQEKMISLELAQNLSLTFSIPVLQVIF